MTKWLKFKKENAVIVEEMKGMGISVFRKDGKTELEEPVCIYIEKKDLKEASE